MESASQFRLSSMQIQHHEKKIQRSGSFGETYQWILSPGSYLWQLRLHAVDNPGLALGRLQQLVELLRVELQALQQAGRPGHDQQQLLDEAGEQGCGLRGLVPRLYQQLLQVLTQLVEVPERKIDIYMIN